MIVTEGTKQKLKDIWIKRKQDPNYDPKIYGRSGENNPFYGKKHSDKTKQLISDANTGRLVGEKSPFYGKTLSDEHRRNMSINHADFKGENHPQYGTHRSDETKQKISDWMNDGNHPMLGKTHSKETKLKMKKAWEKRKLIPMSDETRQLISINHADVSGENNPFWNGGSSFEPYCFEFTEWLKEEIKERDNHQCKNPDCWKTNKKLVVHHIDYDKKNCSTDNLITLCNSCNGRANSNREYWQSLYMSLTNCLTKI